MCIKKTKEHIDEIKKKVFIKRFIYYIQTYQNKIFIKNNSSLFTSLSNMYINKINITILSLYTLRLNFLEKIAIRKKRFALNIFLHYLPKLVSTFMKYKKKSQIVFSTTLKRARNVYRLLKGVLFTPYLYKAQH